MISRVCHFYSFSFRDVMSMPVEAFWTLNNNIVRVSAERDIRQLTLLNMAGSQEGAKEYRQSLERELGEPVKFSPIAAKPDKEGIDFLKTIRQGA